MFVVCCSSTLSRKLLQGMPADKVYKIPTIPVEFLTKEALYKRTELTSVHVHTTNNAKKYYAQKYTP